ncbi:MAG: hypothetical protein BMS9Abin12_0261 [Acidimicrobiia bacterium]|nr:MAG: hypothetical protein BMS9Abin12_0261 [Acidimicrobiia bacterium]
MKSFFRFLFVLLIVGAVAAVVASIVSKKKLESMSDDEIREYLSIKLSGKVGDEQLGTIQDAVLTGVRGKKPAADHYTDDVDDTMDDAGDEAEEADEEAAKAGESAAE